MWETVISVKKTVVGAGSAGVGRASHTCAGVALVKQKICSSNKYPLALLGGVGCHCGCRVPAMTTVGPFLGGGRCQRQPWHAREPGGFCWGTGLEAEKESGGLFFSFGL